MSERREAIMALLAEKKTTREIAGLLKISIGAVRYYREPSKRANNVQICARIARHRCRIKAKAIAYSGGACLKCGYNRCAAAIEFHHLDPTVKESRISSGKTLSWLKLKPEIDKTIMICANCHRELHDDLWVPSDEMVATQLSIRVAYIDQPLTVY